MKIKRSSEELERLIQDGFDAWVESAYLGPRPMIKHRFPTPIATFVVFLSVLILTTALVISVGFSCRESFRYNRPAPAPARVVFVSCLLGNWVVAQGSDAPVNGDGVMAITPKPPGRCGGNQPQRVAPRRDGDYLSC